MKTYIYDGKKYFNEKEVRDAIFKKEHKFFAKTPQSKVAEFWAKHKVEYAVEESGIHAAKYMKKGRVKQAFKSWLESAKLESSLGFKIDANPKSRNSIDDLLETLGEGETVSFRDAYNDLHDLTAEELKTLKREIAQNNIYAHEQKWALDKRVEEASDAEELRKIRVQFLGKVFERKE